MSFPLFPLSSISTSYPQIGWNFLGMQKSGLFRNWPLIYQCRTEKQCSGCSDPRFRGWYVNRLSVGVYRLFIEAAPTLASAGCTLIGCL